MNELIEIVKDILTINGVAYPLVREAWNYARYRRRRKDSLEESVRKDLWNEITNLRDALRGATNTLMDWQSKYLELLSQHKTAIEQLSETQQNFVTLGALLNRALRALDRLEAVERHIAEPDLDRAKAEIVTMKLEAESIREKAAILYQT